MFQEIPLDQIRFTRRNPRSNPDEDIEELAASIGAEDNPRLAQFPLVEELGEGEYRVIAGERRIRAAALRGWKNMPCMVASRLDPLEVHTLRIAENLHRKDLHPLDEAAALKIAWLSANAEAIGVGDDARAILDSDLPNPQTIESLQTLLADHGFAPTVPAVPWEVVLDQLGVSMHPEKRKKLLAVLTLDSSVQEAVKTLDVSEAGLRAIGRLDVEEQQRLVNEIAENPDLARKVRHISSQVQGGKHTLDDALALARGELPAHLRDEDAPATDNATLPEQFQRPPLVEDQRLAELIVRCLDLASQVETAFAALAQLGHVNTFAAPWDEAAAEALATIRKAIQSLEA
jgi:ParB-like chromosome segregation protein Spo0J